MAANKKLLILPGDGGGPEVMREVRRLIDWMSRRRIVTFDVAEDLVGGASIDARGTPLEAEYRAGRLRLFSAREYGEVACDFLERIPDTVAVQRLVGDTTSEGVLLAPTWTETKTEIFQLITQEFERRGTRQGALVRGLISSSAV